jgi:hypothetical protein
MLIFETLENKVFLKLLIILSSESYIKHFAIYSFTYIYPKVFLIFTLRTSMSLNSVAHSLVFSWGKSLSFEGRLEFWKHL